MDPKTNCDHLRLDNQVCFALYSATNALTRAYRPLLAQFDITYLQYMVLMVLWEQQRLSVKSLGKRLHLDSGTLTPLLTRLESKGLVIKKRSERDERIREISLTPQGEALQQKLKATPGQLACQVNLPAHELLELKRLSELLLSNLTGDHD